MLVSFRLVEFDLFVKFPDLVELTSIDHRFLNHLLAVFESAEGDLVSLLDLQLMQSIFEQSDSCVVFSRNPSEDGDILQ